MAGSKPQIFLIFAPMQKLSMEQLQRPSVEAFKAQDKLPVTVVLDNVRSMHNVGSVFRTADGFAVERIFLCGITGTPPHREIEKTALGATQSIDWQYFGTTQEAAEQLQREGYRLMAVEQAHESTMLHDFDPQPGGKLALFFGNEVHGVSAPIMAMVDGSLEIPQFGTKHSFNIAVAAGIVLWECYRRMQLRGPAGE